MGSSDLQGLSLRGLGWFGKMVVVIRRLEWSGKMVVAIRVKIFTRLAGVLRLVYPSKLSSLELFVAKLVGVLDGLRLLQWT